MQRRSYKIEKGSTTERFHQSRAKFQFIGGGFGSGKTTAVVIKGLRLAKDYPGSNGLVARATFPKLNDTIRKEWFKWMPSHWIKSFTKTDNTLELANGTTVNFRYISQRGNEAGEGTSNLLSATYDWIIVDQMEDPEIQHKDFLDLVGRLRGNAAYAGDDPTMPLTGPRWFMFTSNPTRNWLYRKIIKPVHDYSSGLWNPDLLCERDPDTEQPIMHGDKPSLLIDLFESSTYENRHNLEPDFLKGLEATYRGQTRERFLLGKWVGYEGQVYPDFDQAIHAVPHQRMVEHFNNTRRRSNRVSIVEGFDHGLAEPSCYLFGFADNNDNVHIMDGFYEPGLGIETLAGRIKDIRDTYGYTPTGDVYEQGILADPAIFRKHSAKVVGPTVASMLAEYGIDTTRANNNLLNGIAKVQAYLYIEQARLHPYHGRWGAPRLYVSDKLHWWIDEVLDYVWMKDKADEAEDKPRDKKNHAMDATRYLLTDRPEPSQLIVTRGIVRPTFHTEWSEPPDEARVA